MIDNHRKGMSRKLTYIRYVALQLRRNAYRFGAGKRLTDSLESFADSYSWVRTLMLIVGGFLGDIAAGLIRHYGRLLCRRG